ncbi:MAG: hypothetical protein ACJ74H_10745 [Thermoanaerobaculia bacterium]
MRIHPAPLLSLLFLLFAVPTFAADECHMGFSAYAAVEPYIVNPAVVERAATRLVGILEDTSADARGAIGWRFDIRSIATGEVIATRRGAAHLAPNVQTEVRASWDARDDAGQPVPDGEYAIELSAVRQRPHNIATESAGARSSEVRVVVDREGHYDALFTERERRKIGTLAASIDPAFPYQFFYGTTHAHTNWSDGGMPTGDCQSGRYGYAGGAQPVDAFNYAKTSGSVDFLAVVEHNHLMQDACTTCSASSILSRYASGFTAAQTATVPGSFVGLFGMEWGVISGGGHINVYNQAQLMSWTGEPYNVLTDKSNYPMLYTAMKNNQGTYGSYGTFNHPESTDFGSWTRSADGDAVMRGLSIVSGPAFSTSTSFAPGGSTYLPRYNQALSYGWRVAPEAHQDNHCWNYGNATPNRTGVLIPNGTTFNQQSLVAAYGARHFFAAQDRDVQLIYRTSDGARVMGDSFNASASTGVYVRVSDPAGDGVQKIEIWAGRAGTNASPGAAPTIVASNTGSATLNATLVPKTAGETWYYYVLAVQTDGNNVWSAPMWITWGTSCTLPAAPALSSPASGATSVSTSPTLSWSAVSGATSYDLYLGASTTPPFYSSTSSTSIAVSGLAASSTYNWKVIAKNACGSGPASAQRSFTTAGGSIPVTLISEGAESGATGWTFTKNTGSGWSIETSTDSHGGAHRFKSNVGFTTYLNSADWSVVSPSFSLAGKTAATLTFYNKYKTESGYDFFRVEVSTNGGTSWTQLRSVSGQSSLYPSWAAQVSLSLNAYAGQSNVKVRFRFTSDSTVADWGVAFDDVVLTAQ